MQSLGRTDPKLLAPPGTVIVHVGPHKTGTTALQAAFHAGRADIAKHGVKYAGSGRQPYKAIQSLLQHKGIKGSVIPDPQLWQDFSAEIRNSDAERTVISCESLDGISITNAERLVEDLGGPERVRIVFMMRRYDKYFPSLWQQLTANGLTIGLTPWIDKVMANPELPVMQRGAYSRQIEVWTKVLPVEPDSCHFSALV